MIPVTMSVVRAPSPLITNHPPPRLAKPQMALGHAGLRERERGEHAERVERDQLGHAGPEDDHQDGCRYGQGDDPVGEHQPVARAS